MYNIRYSDIFMTNLLEHKIYKHRWIYCCYLEESSSGVNFPKNRPCDTWIRPHNYIWYFIDLPKIAIYIFKPFWSLVYFKDMGSRCYCSIGVDFNFFLLIWCGNILDNVIHKTSKLVLILQKKKITYSTNRKLRRPRGEKVWIFYLAYTRIFHSQHYERHVE